MTILVCSVGCGLVRRLRYRLCRPQRWRRQSVHKLVGIHVPNQHLAVAPTCGGSFTVRAKRHSVNWVLRIGKRMELLAIVRVPNANYFVGPSGYDPLAVGCAGHCVYAAGMRFELAKEVTAIGIFPLIVAYSP